MLQGSEIKLNSLPVASIYGIELDFEFLQSEVLQLGKALVADAVKLGSRMIEGARALVESFKNGTFGNIFSRWAKESPLAAGAGVAAAGLAGGAILIVGGAVVGTVTGAISGIAGAIGGTGWGGTLMSLIGGGIGAGVATTALQVTNFVWNFDWNQTDASIEAEIKSAIENLYTSAGEVLGKGLATLVVGGRWQPTRLEIDVRQAAYQYVMNEEIREDLISSMSELIYASLNAFKILVVKRAYMNGRRGLKKLWANLPPEFRSGLPKLDKAIKAWGEEETGSFSFASEYEERVVEKIDDTKLRNAWEGFTGGFWQQFSNAVTYKD